MNKFFKKKSEITNWLHKNNIGAYDFALSLEYGFMVNVDANVYLYGKKLDFIPVKFHHINGDFNCGNNNLSSLEFSPSLVKGTFNCSNNKLISLEFCPQSIEDDFDCTTNQLRSLEHCPQTVGRRFYGDNNPGLGEFQKVTYFSRIYTEHLRVQEVKNFASGLNDALVEKSSGTAKIKL